MAPLTLIFYSLLTLFSGTLAQENNDTLSPAFPYGAFELQDDTSAGYLLTIPQPPPFELNDSLQLTFQSVDAIKQNLAVVLPQLDIPQDVIDLKVEEGAPLINSTVMSLLTETSENDTMTIYRRQSGNSLANFFEGIGGIASDVGCAAYAAGGVAGFLAAAAIFEGQNSRSLPITTDQDFFVHALYGDTASSASVRVFYNAKYAPGFAADISAVTFNRRIYTRFPAAPYGDRQFNSITGLLMHEMQHVKQYGDFGYDLGTFGYQYLFQHCKAGFNYFDPRFVLEQTARNKEADISATLLRQDPGRQFFEIWRRSNLLRSIGYPSQRNFTTIQRTRTRHVIELRFTHGRMSLDISNPNQLCARAFNRNNVAGAQVCGPSAVITVPAVPPPAPLRPRCPPDCPRVPPAECRTDSNHEFPECDAARRRRCDSLWEICEEQPPT